MGKKEVGKPRNDGRPPRLPKDPDKRSDEQFIREWAKNNGCSISVARAYWNQGKEDES